MALKAVIEFKLGIDGVWNPGDAETLSGLIVAHPEWAAWTVDEDRLVVFVRSVDCSVHATSDIDPTEDLYCLIFRHVKSHKIRINLMGIISFMKSAVKHYRRQAPKWMVREQLGGVWMCLKQLFQELIKGEVYMGKCECADWGRSRGKVITQHHSCCPEYDPEGDAKEVISALIRGIEAWAADEDGVHPALYDADMKARIFWQITA